MSHFRLDRENGLCECPVPVGNVEGEDERNSEGKLAVSIQRPCCLKRGTDFRPRWIPLTHPRNGRGVSSPRRKKEPSYHGTVTTLYPSVAQ